MSCSESHGILESGRDYNPPVPPIPADHEPATPEFLNELIRELNALRQRDSELFAARYPPMSPDYQPPKEPPYEKKEQLRQESEEIQMKMAGLRTRISSLAILLARQPPAKPELDEATPAAYPADASTAPEVQRGPALPVQKPNESYTSTNVPRT